MPYRNRRSPIPGCLAATVMTIMTPPVLGRPPLTWWSSRIIEDCTRESSPEWVRLGSCRDGAILGVIDLPYEGTWELRFCTIADEAKGRSQSDYVDLFIDDELVGRYFNDHDVRITHTITGDEVPYQFVFHSEFSLSHLHMHVSTGEAVDTSCPWDLTGDGLVDFADLLRVLGAWGESACGSSHDDVDFDGAVDLQDLLLILANWGPCP